MKPRFIAAYAALLALIFSCGDNSKPEKPDDGKTPAVETSLSVSPSSLRLHGEGEKLTVSLKTNSSWTSSTQAGWVSVTPAKGEGDASVSISVPANPDTHNSREAVLIFSAGDKSFALNISQDPGTAGASGLNVEVSTGAASSITYSTAVLSASFENASATVREVGFEWGSSSTSLDEVLQADVPSTGASGQFTKALEGLGSGHTYYYRAYVVLQDGDDIDTFYGNVRSFTTATQDNPPQTSLSQPGWAELPGMSIGKSGSYMVNTSDKNEYYAWHISPDVKGPGGKYARNYTVCYSAEYHCPLWVAAPRHSMYVGSANRTDAYKKDPDIPSDIQYSSKSTGGGCNKGHMLGSAERTASTETNRQVFYYTNIAPQLSSGFNTGGGGWNILEDWVDGQVCADTLYEVIGCYFKTFKDGYGNTVNPKTISFGSRNDVSMPTMFYYVLLRTKSGSSGKSVKDCSASELKCAAFVRAHTNDLKGVKVSSKEIMSVADLEKITGVKYFENVPNAPKSSFSASDWGL